VQISEVFLYGQTLLAKHHQGWWVENMGRGRARVEFNQYQGLSLGRNFQVECPFF
jgi:hypothetical protein